MMCLQCRCPSPLNIKHQLFIPDCLRHLSLHSAWHGAVSPSNEEEQGHFVFEIKLLLEESASFPVPLSNAFLLRSMMV